MVYSSSMISHNIWGKHILVPRLISQAAEQSHVHVTISHAGNGFCFSLVEILNNSRHIDVGMIGVPGGCACSLKPAPQTAQFVATDTIHYIFAPAIILMFLSRLHIIDKKMLGSAEAPPNFGFSVILLHTEASNLLEIIVSIQAFSCLCNTPLCWPRRVDVTLGVHSKHIT